MLMMFQEMPRLKMDLLVHVFIIFRIMYCIKWIWKLAMLGCVKFLLPEILVYSDLCISNNFVDVVISTHN